MCGRFSNKFEARKLLFRYVADNQNFQFQPNRNIAPTPEDQEQVWVDLGFTNPVLLKGLLKPYPAGLMKAESLEFIDSF